MQQSRPILKAGLLLADSDMELSAATGEIDLKYLMNQVSVCGAIHLLPTVSKKMLRTNKASWS